MSFFAPNVMCFLLIATVACLAAWEDVTSLRISNRHSLVLLIMFPLVVTLCADMAGWSGLGAAVYMSFVGLILYAMGVMGAGDVKLATVLSLYIGWDEIGAYMIGMALTGGVVALVTLYYRKHPSHLPPTPWPPESWPAQIVLGRTVLPYGVAITLPAILLLAMRLWGFSTP